MPRQRPREIPVEKGDQLTIPFDGLGAGPDGLGRVDDYIVFVPGTLPGERATVEITSAARKFGRGELIKLVTRSPDRVEPRCPHFLACGGCHRQHQSYPAQLLDKQARLQRTIDHALGEATVPVATTVPAASPYGERHKVVVHLLHDARGRLQGGLHRARSPDLVAVHDCPASDPLAWDLVQRTIELLDTLGHRAWDPWFAPRELLRSVLVRTSTIGDAHLILVATAPEIPGLEDLLPELHRAGATSISVNHNDGEPARLLGPDTRHLSGRSYIEEPLAGLRFRISPTVFFQTSPRMAEQLIEHVLDWLQPRATDDVADLYCGTGLLTLPLAKRARSAFGIELNGHALDDARASALANQIGNTTFRCGDVAGWLRACRQGQLPRPQLVAMDPPRSGLGPEVIGELAQLRPERLAYVSCEPQALHEDLRALAAAGFVTKAVVPFDMFPQTALVESMACLERSM
ncbi:MAG: 23S rRNA (uracil(1939)-C(5))-methyltransferase RlmD [Planctomycetes bacterium]|jgi:23S rRNA (uracil1939-C5)-methyltransferase|nr:23S rRNA (uracil(1939)-C(5))-methyltransferase RlmD [Planctomycetota bacterium]